jgi:hypothetical protein
MGVGLKVDEHAVTLARRVAANNERHSDAGCRSMVDPLPQKYQISAGHAES